LPSNSRKPCDPSIALSGPVIPPAASNAANMPLRAALPAATPFHIDSSPRVSRQTLYDILDERQPVTPVMALRLRKLCGNGPDLWLNLAEAL
jgi:hypothetical protein